METRTIHSNDERGDQQTLREVEHEGETYRFEVDLDAAEDAEADGHSVIGENRVFVPEAVEQALTEFGAGPEEVGDE